MIPQCVDQGVGVIPWSPLARGVLAGNRTRGGDRLTTRSDTDDFTDYLYRPAHRLRRRGAGGRGGGRARRARRPRWPWPGCSTSPG